MTEEKSKFFNSRKKSNAKLAEESKELGFGSAASGERTRRLNQDGSFNVRRSGLTMFQKIHIYHDLIEMPWGKFSFMVLGFYTLANFIFALFYMWAGVQHLSGVIGNTIVEKFWEAFFFSAQTLTTVGYGRISPEGFTTSVIASVESMVGLMGFALITGILYGKFAKPNAKILFSNQAVIAPYKGINAFEFRIVNERENQLIELEVQIFLSLNKEVNGVLKSLFLPLTLESNKLSFFPLPWTIVHPIDDDSPINGFTEKMLTDSRAEFIILLKAYDDTFAQNVYRRFSYTYKEITWGAKYNVIYETDNDGILKLNINHFHDIEMIKLNDTTTNLTEN